MPELFTEWTVLPHRPIEKVADNLWRVSGKLGQVQRQMVLARMRDGRIVVDNAVRLHRLHPRADRAGLGAAAPALDVDKDKRAVAATSSGSPTRRTCVGAMSGHGDPITEDAPGHAKKILEPMGFTEWDAFERHKADSLAEHVRRRTPE